MKKNDGVFFWLIIFLIYVFSQRGFITTDVYNFFVQPLKKRNSLQRHGLGGLHIMTRAKIAHTGTETGYAAIASAISFFEVQSVLVYLHCIV